MRPVSIGAKHELSNAEKPKGFHTERYDGCNPSHCCIVCVGGDVGMNRGAMSVVVTHIGEQTLCKDCSSDRVGHGGVTRGVQVVIPRRLE